jgi:ectoine hydroxylase-related dioxygenase (phytanoyl-CoA dioxygenase family)
VVLSEINCSIKNRDNRRTHSLHTDQVGTPPPLPNYAQMVNITWALTDYTKENGATSLVPCSHRFGRMPLAYEADFLDNPTVPAIPAEAKAGSLIIWHGATWHGAYPRTNPGVRANLWMVFTRSYMRPIRDFRSEVTPEMLARNPPEFANLMGMHCIYPQNPKLMKEGGLKGLMQAVNAGEGQWS